MLLDERSHDQLKKYSTITCCDAMTKGRQFLVTELEHSREHVGYKNVIFAGARVRSRRWGITLGITPRVNLLIHCVAVLRDAMYL